MGYNTGVFTLFNQAQNYTTVSADLKKPIFSPPPGFSYASVYGKSVAPTITTSGTGSILSAYGLQIAPRVDAGITISNAYGLNLVGPLLNTGTLSNAYTFFVASPTVSGGAITNNYTAFFGLPSIGTNQGGVGIGTTTPQNALDISGSMAVGGYAGTTTISFGNLAISGNATTTIAVGVGTTTPAYTLDITGILNTGAAYGWMPQRNNQQATLSQGQIQGGFGGGSVGVQKTMSANTTSVFNTTTSVNSNSAGFKGASFDGRYIYLVPFQNSATHFGQITRFDTTQNFLSSSSYSIYDTTANVNSNSRGFRGSVFDGRYVYFVPARISGNTTAGQITRYDTTLPFTRSTSYSTFDLVAQINSGCRGFQGGVFDGRYVYYTPFYSTPSFSGQVVQYDTTLNFSASTSYATYNLLTQVNSNSVGFIGGVFDGRYVYFIQYATNFVNAGQITRYDTSLSFTNASSYSTFETGTNINSNSVGFNGAVFDGRYIYLIPNLTSMTYLGQVTRYDTTLPLSSSTSYLIFDLAANVNSNSQAFQGGVFDGRYLYFVPSINTFTVSGQVTRYDTTLPFTSSSSYSLFNMEASVNSLSGGFFGAIFDGQYIYFVPNQMGPTFTGQITRFSAYTGPNVNAIAASGAPNSFAIGSYAGTSIPSLNNLIVSGSVGIGTSTPGYLLDISGSVNAQYVYGLMPQFPNQMLSLAEGYNQSGLGSGAVGVQKTMSGNTTVPFNLSSINSLNTSFVGTAFDGRYVYFVPSIAGNPIARFDTVAFFGASASFISSSAYYVSSVNNILDGGSSFDGRYVYFIPGSNGQLTRYDTTYPFTLSTSYSVVDLTVLTNANSATFSGAVFDGRYLYLVPGGAPSNGQITRYDTTGSLSLSASYSVFDTTTVQSNSKNFNGGTFDGRYVYFVPANSSQPGQITQFDTTLPFGTSTSYAVFDTQSVNTASQGFFGAVFDGRFIYLIPNKNGQITRYDTTGSFLSSASYAFFNTTLFFPTSSGLQGGCFDGRYVYFFSGSQNTGSFTRYDTTQSFLNQTSYSVFASGASTQLQGGIFDGRYIYAAPSNSSIAIRIDAYPGPFTNAIAASNLPNGFAIGDYAGVTLPPTNGLIVSGQAGFGTSTPSYELDVAGSIKAQYVYGLATQGPNQTIALAEGYNQGGFGGGFVGTQKTMSQNTTLYFDTTTVNSISLGFNGGIFDGRYVYLIPGTNGQITRYDTTLPYSTSTSYSIFNLSGKINSLSFGFSGAVFDGRYIYFVPNTNTILTRYDTTRPFQVLTSYSTYTLSNSYISGAFDGRYIYLSGTLNTALQYDTTQSFISASSYVTSPTLAISQFAGSSYDGRYVYFVPNDSAGTVEIYDTTLPFNVGSSFTSLALNPNVSTSSFGFWGAVFDGRYLYYIPNTTTNGAITRYDTLGIFATTSSYSVFDTRANVNSLSEGFEGGSFDGRYVYFVPSSSGLITRYDTTQSFFNAASYTIFNTATGNAGSTSFTGSIFDGRYLYLIPNNNGTSGLVTRLDAYPGPAGSVFAVNQAPNFLAIGTYAGSSLVSANNLVVSGSVGIGTTTPKYTVDVAGAVNAGFIEGLMASQSNQTIGLAEGNTQGGLGGGSVGTNKTLSANTTLAFNTASLINSNSTGFNGALFDGRFVYLVPGVGSGQITRFDATGIFGASPSYATYNMVNVSSLCIGFNGSLFDGRYIYYIPATNNLFTRFDTTAPFALLSSYATQALSPSCSGGIFDGRYAYITSGVSTVLNRYDTTLSFTSAGSFTTFDTTAVVAGGNYLGGSFDGRYVYFAPYDSGTGGKLLRYDTTLSFTQSSSYLSFDLAANLNSLSVSFWGSTFDGRYVYLSPYFNSNVNTNSGQLTRYDTQSNFSSASSYLSINLTTLINSLASGFQGAQYDGRFVYLFPSGNNLVVCFDTTESFTNSSSYSTQIVTGYGYGGTFDGRYIYATPHNTGIFNRFDAYPGPQATAIAANQAPSGFSVGAYAGTTTLLGGLIVSGSVGIGTTTPAYALDVIGTVSVQAAYGYMPQANNQLVSLFEGNNQGGFGGGSVGTNKTMGVNTTLTFNTAANVNSNSLGFTGAIFDGRYVYFVPATNLITRSGQITRFDTTLSFSNPLSYQVFDTVANVNSNSCGFFGGVFDGQYVYFVPHTNITASGLITRYNTSLSFLSPSSYSVFDTAANINSNSCGFEGGVFDGRYIYFVPHFTKLAFSGLVTRFDTTANFLNASSYSIFDTGTFVNSNSTGFVGGAFDGRYVYYVPIRGGVSGQVTLYDTTLSFSNTSSYTIFDLAANVNSNSLGFQGAIFDGRYLYYVPYFIGSPTFIGQITRYDTTLSFTSTVSYSIFDLAANVNSKCQGFIGGVFDGRYVYFVPSQNTSTFSGAVARYDTTAPFGVSTSYNAFDTLISMNSNSVGFAGGIFDGRYVYLVPSLNLLNTAAGQITRLDGYPGAAASGIIAATGASNGFTLGTGITNATTATTATEGAATIPPLPVGYIILTINGTARKIPYYN